MLNLKSLDDIANICSLLDYYGFLDFYFNTIFSISIAMHVYITF